MRVWWGIAILNEASPMSTKWFDLAVLLAIASAVVAAGHAVAQNSTWPDGIESLVSKYLSEIPGMVFTSLEVHCNSTDCLAVFTTADETPRLPSGEQLSLLHTQGWNVVSVSSGGRFDPVTGKSEGFVRLSNDTRLRSWVVPL
jgi:hypothetical protein